MNLPTDFELYTRKLFGDKLYATFSQALDEEPPVSIRLNPFKVSDNIIGNEAEEDCNQKLQTSNFKLQTPNFKLQTSNFKHQTSNFKLQRVPWCPLGYYLNDRPAFTFDPLLHAGLYYVQEASSMFVCEVARQLFHAPVMMLDLCAAPGGKTTALRSVLPEGSLLFTNEPIKTRASILKENVEKFGHPDVIVTNNYPRDYKKSKLTFDAILADVPCSGEGMFRKDPNAIKEWSTQNVEKCRQLQRSIVEDIWQCLKPNGILIYSTCTFNAHEDEENVKWIADNLGADFVKVENKEDWHITGSLIDNNPVCHFIPGVTQGEGLFMAVLRKHANNKQDTKAKSSNRHRTPSKINVKDWLCGDFELVEEKDFMRAIPKQWVDIYDAAKATLHIIHAGVGIGTVKGRNIVPDASLALSVALNDKAFQKAELSCDEAIRYLRKEAITLDATLPKGITVVTFKGQPLGFAKNLGNRANNLYPQEWRIKSTHIAEEITSPLLPEGLEDAL